MAYLTTAELEQRIGAREVVQLSDRENERAANQAVIDAAISDAEAEANGYLGVRYPLPLDAAPDQVKSIVASIARYNLFRRNVPEGHAAYVAYVAAVRALERIARGDVILPIEVGTAEVPQAGAIYYTAPDPVFDTRGLL